VENLRRIAVRVMVVYWACCLAAHVVVAVTRPGPLPGYSYAYWFILTMVVALVASNVAKPPGPVAEDKAPRWYVTALGVTALICGLWPWAVGSGVPNAPSLLGVFGDTGVPGGPPGDRDLHSHGRRVRAITEGEFQRVEAWNAVVQSGLMACFSGMVLAVVLYFRQARGAAGAPGPPGS